MTNSKVNIQPKKRGRKSGEEVLQQVALALKNIQVLERLEESPLARLPEVRQVADTRYRRAIFPVGFAMQFLLSEAVGVIVQDLAQMPNYQRELKFLKGFVQGESVAEISRSLGLSREHVARTIQPKAVSLVARVFLMRVGSVPASESFKPTVPREGRNDRELSGVGAV